MNVRRKWTSTEIRTLASRYPVEGPVLLMEELGRSKNSITSQARRLWVKADSRWRRSSVNRVMHNTTVNSRFFDQPSPESAYVCGFVFGCGTIKSRHRWVLKLRVDVHRMVALKRVLDLIKSKHQIQQYGSWNIVEICNSRLVKQLLQNFGQPPGRLNLDPSLPDLPVELIPHFARGHLDGAGLHASSILRWTGTSHVINELTEHVGEVVKSEPTTRHRVYGKVSVAWLGRENVRRIQDWLNPDQNLCRF